MAIDSVSSSTAAALALQAPLRPRADEALRTAPATTGSATNESPEARRSGDAQGAAQSQDASQSQGASESQRAAQRPAEVSEAASAADQARPTLNTAGQTVGRIVDTTA